MMTTTMQLVLGLWNDNDGIVIKRSEAAPISGAPRSVPCQSCKERPTNNREGETTSQSTYIDYRPTTILDLPNEVLEDLFILAVEPDLTSDLHGFPWYRLTKTQKILPRLELVNHRFSQIARRVRDRYWADINAEGYEEPASSLKFAIHLLHSPESRFRLHHLELHTCIRGTEQAEHKTGPAPPQKDLDDLANEVARLHLPGADRKFQQEWVSNLQAGVIESYPPLIAEWARNLTSLAITIPLFPAANPTTMLLRWLKNKFDPSNPGMLASANDTAPFPKLQSVFLRRWDHTHHISYDQVAPFFYLPSLRALYIERIGLGCHAAPWVEDRGPTPEAPMGKDTAKHEPQLTRIGAMSNIKELCLAESRLNFNALHDIISHCRELKVIKISCARCSRGNVLKEPAWSRLLELQASSLEELTIECPQSFPQWRCFANERIEDITLGFNFAQLHRLRKLRVNWWQLGQRWGPLYAVDVTRLPASLEELIIVDSAKMQTCQSSCSNLRDLIVKGPSRVLAECKPDGRLPNLRILDLTSILRADLQYDCLTDLKNFASRRGVKLKLDPTPTRYGHWAR